MAPSNSLPQHVGIILDGNRRWAKEHGLPITKGHQKGAQVLMDVSLFAFDQGITYLSVYVFSIENWKRSKTEVRFILKLLAQVVKKHLNSFNEKNIKVVILGSPQNVPDDLMHILQDAQQKTAQNTAGVMSFCFNYGGRQEIIETAQKMLADGVKSSKITQEIFSQYIYEPSVPDIDLIIRTSGEQRLSGFMLWRAAYAELLFVTKYWPDYTTSDFLAALQEYSIRQRRYGK